VSLPADQAPVLWPGFCAIALLLGLRHGLDADHLATVDGLVRANAARRPRLAATAGVWFSLGHGSAVALIAVVASAWGASWTPPAWLKASGAAVSIAGLIGLGLFNLCRLSGTKTVSHAAPSGPRAILIGRLHLGNAWAIVGVGLLFALSFDTVSQAMVFAALANRYGGVAQVLVIAACFVCGITAVDGLNGWWICRLVRRADAGARTASRIMTAGVALLSLALGGVLLAAVVFPAAASWLDGHETALGVLVIAAASLAFLLGVVASRRPQPQPQPQPPV
jgi:high-affinity nickel-transport protein